MTSRDAEAVDPRDSGMTGIRGGGAGPHFVPRHYPPKGPGRTKNKITLNSFIQVRGPRKACHSRDFLAWDLVSWDWPRSRRRPNGSRWHPWQTVSTRGGAS